MESTNEIITSPDKEEDTPPEISIVEQSHSTPSLAKKKSEIMKDPAARIFPVYPKVFSTKIALSTRRDHHLLPMFLHARVIFKA